MEKYANALAEIDVILYYLSSEDYEKIPKEVIEIIKKYKNEDYVFEYNEDVDLQDQVLLPETKAILYNFFRDYWATSEQKEKILKWQQEDRINAEIKRKEEFEYKDLFSDSKLKKENIEDTINDDKELVEYKESLFSKIKNWINSIFKI